MDLASPWCDVGDETRRLFFLASLRTSLCKNQTSWEMEIFNPLQILHAVRHSGGMHKNALFKGRSTLVAMVTTAACSGPEASFLYKTLQKRVKCLFLYLKLNTTLQIGTCTIYRDIILYFSFQATPKIVPL